MILNLMLPVLVPTDITQEHKLYQGSSTQNKKKVPRPTGKIVSQKTITRARVLLKDLYK